MGKITSYQTAEYGKFEEIVGSSLYPPVSVTRWSYPDTTDAFPENSGLLPVSSVDIYHKYAVLTKLINPEDIKVSLSADSINVNLGQIEVNTDEIEGLIRDSNFILSATRLEVNNQFDETQTLLSALTSLQSEKQDSIISAIKTLSAVNRINGFVIPDYNRIKNYYYGSSNNISQVDYKMNTTVVASLSFTYTGDSSIDGALIDEVIKL